MMSNGEPFHNCRQAWERVIMVIPCEQVVMVDAGPYSFPLMISRRSWFVGVFRSSLPGRANGSWLARLWMDETSGSVPS